MDEKDENASDGKRSEATMMSDDQRRRLEEARARREADLAELAETAQQSFASFLMELFRPFVRKAVEDASALDDRHRLVLESVAEITWGEWRGVLRTLLSEVDARARSAAAVGIVDAVDAVDVGDAADPARVDSALGAGSLPVTWRVLRALLDDAAATPDSSRALDRPVVLRLTVDDHVHTGVLRSIEIDEGEDDSAMVLDGDGDEDVAALGVESATDPLEEQTDRVAAVLVLDFALLRQLSEMIRSEPLRGEATARSILAALSDLEGRGRCADVDLATLRAFGDDWELQANIDPALARAAIDQVALLLRVLIDRRRSLSRSLSAASIASPRLTLEQRSILGAWRRSCRAASCDRSLLEARRLVFLRMASLLYAALATTSGRVQISACEFEELSLLPTITGDCDGDRFAAMQALLRVVGARLRRSS